jgi:hypothetical protein
MVRAHTRRVVAAVQHAYRWFDRAVVQRERETVNTDANGTAMGTADVDASVSLRVDRSGPLPAGRAQYGVNGAVFVDASPQPRCKRYDASSHADSIAAFTYWWVRGQVSAADVERVRAYFKAIGYTLVC